MRISSVIRSFAVTALLLSTQVVMAQDAQTPAQLLSGFPNGGPDMVTQVQALMSADKANLAAIIAFAKIANEDQRKAIGQALAQIAKSSAPNDPAFATQIQQEVAASGLPDLAKAYADAAGDTGTASTGGGGGGGGGGGPTAAGPPAGGQNDSSTTNDSTFAVNDSTGLTNSTLGGGGSSVSPF